MRITESEIYAALNDPKRATKLIQLAYSYPSYRKFYRNDPIAWLHDCIIWRPGEKPAPYQEKSLATLLEKKRLAERGPRGLGKTATAAWVILWFATTRDIDEDWKIPTTASHWRQLSKFLWPEVHKWSRRLNWKVIGRPPFDRYELLSLNLKLKTGEAFAAASDDSETLEGAHADSLLYIFDESKIIPDSTWDSIEGTFMSQGEGYWLALGTPGAPVGRFYDIHSRKPGFEDWATIHVSLEEAIKAGRVSQERVQQLERQWGKDHPMYKTHVLGEFAEDRKDGIIPLAWVEQAIKRWHELYERDDWDDLTEIGVDVARFGEDQTVLAMRHDWAIKELRKYQKHDTMEIASIVEAAARQGNPKIVVDVIGVGAGVYDYLRKNTSLQVEAFNAAERSDQRDRSGEFGFVNRRAEAWWRMRELLDPEFGEPIALPPDDDLIGELVTPRYKLMLGGKIQVESKDDLRKPSRLGRSPDCADAVVMAFDEPKSFGITF